MRTLCPQGMVQTKQTTRRYLYCPTHLLSSSPDDISKNESTTNGPRTGGKGGGLLKATRGSTFLSFVTIDSLEVFSFPCLWGVVIVIIPVWFFKEQTWEENVRHSGKGLYSSNLNQNLEEGVAILASPLTGLICLVLVALCTRNLAAPLIWSQLCSLYTVVFRWRNKKFSFSKHVKQVSLLFNNLSLYR